MSSEREDQSVGMASEKPDLNFVENEKDDGNLMELEGFVFFVQGTVG